MRIPQGNNIKKKKIFESLIETVHVSMVLYRT